MLRVERLLEMLLVASVTAISVKWIKMPYAAALVIAGLIMGSCHVMPPVVMTPNLILMIFLPALLFEASWDLDLRALRRDWMPIAFLAAVGVLICILAVAFVLHCAGVALGHGLDNRLDCLCHRSGFGRDAVSQNWHGRTPDHATAEAQRKDGFRSPLTHQRQ